MKQINSCFDSGLISKVSYSIYANIPKSEKEVKLKTLLVPCIRYGSLNLLQCGTVLFVFDYQPLLQSTDAQGQAPAHAWWEDTSSLSLHTACLPVFERGLVNREAARMSCQLLLTNYKHLS